MGLIRLWPGIVWAAILAAGTGGCVRYQSQSLSPARQADRFEQRSLADPGLRSFLETNGVVAAWPRDPWDLDTLTLAAFYHHPDLDLARARWRVAMAGQVTAGQRPNPSLAFTPRLNSSAIGSGVTPWILGGTLDIPLETMGKRGHRVAQAQHLGQMARLELATTAWQVRSRVRLALLALQTARETAALLRDPSDTLGRVAQLVEHQWQAGEVSPVEVSSARIVHQTAQLELNDTQRLEADALGALAEALGVPARSLAGVDFRFADPGLFPTNLTAAGLRREAVLNRADILGALAAYAASESALQLQIAKQYPDIHLRPGYELDQDQNKWMLGVSLDLPVLNQNQGPIAEARARREECAAKFNATQAKALGEIDRATAVYLATAAQAAATDHILAGLQSRRAAMQRRHEAGEVAALAVATAQAELAQGRLARLKAGLEAQKALAALENVVQSPLTLPAQPGSLEAAVRPTVPPGNP